MRGKEKEKMEKRKVGLIRYLQFKTQMALARCKRPVISKILLATLYGLFYLDKSVKKLASLAKSFWSKTKAFLAKCNDRHPVILKITLIVLSVVSFAVFFKACFPMDWMTSWKLAAILIPVIYIHELGHAWAFKKCGIAVRGIYFIPFLGAMTMSRTDSKNDFEQDTSHTAEAFVYFMGPAWGLAVGAIATGVYFLTNVWLFADIAIWSVFLNFFNLIPLMPMDGGGVVKGIVFSISRRFGLILMGVFILAIIVLTCFYIQGLIGWLVSCFILLLAIRDLRHEYIMRKYSDPRRPMSRKMIAVFTLSYFAAVAVSCGIIYLILIL